ncbi:DUF4214 domain-containing protein [Jiella sp. M17.18]|uniref:DUF4214 domain-containing protein n=1 Tax=Jiella sp. M17.18 TaxID=3234247 RepID=UPI0034E02F76
MATIDTIRQYFADILQRSGPEVSDSEINAYVSAVNSGALTLDQVRSALISSPEGQNVQEVVRLYQTVFGRVPDKGGLDYQVDTLRGPATEVNLANSFAASPEFTARFGGNTVNTAFINAVYQQVLGRTPSATEVQYYLDSGFSAGRIALAFSESPEFKAAVTPAVVNFLDAAGQGTATYSGSLGSLGATVNVGSTFTLTTGVDNIAGTAANDTIVGTVSQSGGNDNSTLQSGDVIKGGAGTDTLRVTSNAATANPIVPTMTGVENVELDQFNANNNYNFVNSDGIKTLTLANGNGAANVQGLHNIVDLVVSNTTGGGLNVNYTGSSVAGTADVQNVSLNNASADLTVGGSTFVAVTGIEKMAVAATGTNNVALFGDNSLNTITVAGAGKVNVVNTLGTNVTTFDASASTGNVSAVFAAGGDVTATGGSGNDFFNFNTGLTTGDHVNGGSGTDTVSVSNNAAYDYSSATNVAPLNALTSIEHLEFDGAGGVILNGTTLTNTTITQFDFNTAGNDTFNNAGSVATYAFDTLNHGSAAFNLSGTNTTLDLALLGTNGTAAANDGTNADVDNITIRTSGAGAATTPVTVHLASNGDLADSLLTGGAFDPSHFNQTGVIDAAAGSTFNIDGAGNLAMGVANDGTVSAGFAHNATINASALTGNLIVSGSDFAGTAGAGGVNTAATNTGVDTINLGSGDDIVAFHNGDASGIIEYATVNGAVGQATGNILHDTVNGFHAGAKGDVLFFGTNAANAVPATDYTAVSATTQSAINQYSGADATLLHAANTVADAHTTAGWTAFDFQGQTYALYEGAASNAGGFANADALVQLTGIHAADLTQANFAG